MFKWRAYLSDGTTFDDTDGKPWEVPCFPRTIMVAQPGVRKRAGYEDIVHGVSFFVYRKDLKCWLGFEQEIFVHDEWMRNARQIEAYRRGALVSEKDYKKTWNIARADLGLPIQK